MQSLVEREIQMYCNVISNLVENKFPINKLQILRHCSVLRSNKLKIKFKTKLIIKTLSTALVIINSN